MLEGAAFRALSVEAKPTKRNPAPPFTTSTLQQAASSRLGFSAMRTMQVAQRLYEGMDIGGETAGLITYMRTDGVQMAPEAIAAARARSPRSSANDTCRKSRATTPTKAKNAQEAHEAIRPTDFSRTPREVRKYLDADQARLYEMIWKRAIASQMQPAEIERTTVEIEAVNGAPHRGACAPSARSSVSTASSPPTPSRRKRTPEDEEDRRLPEIRAGEALERETINVTQHTTEPPPRYSEATLIKKMEELGIGRPSTYTATLKTLEDRDYVTIDKRKLIPQAKGRLLYGLPRELLRAVCRIRFHRLARGKARRDFRRQARLEGRAARFLEGFLRPPSTTSRNCASPTCSTRSTRNWRRWLFPAREDGSNPRICPKCGTGNAVAEARQIRRLRRLLELSRMQLYPPARRRQRQWRGRQRRDGDKVLGKDPYTAEEITLRSGRFGPYVQRGDGKEAKRSSLPKGWTADTIDHEKALALLSLPRDVGKHPENPAR